MLLSELQNITNDKDIIEIVNEQEFERFSRTTSEIDVPCCVYIVSERYMNTIPECASMIITSKEIANGIKDNNRGICISNNPKATYFKFFVSASEMMKQTMDDTEIGQNCVIGEHSHISKKGVLIGKNVIIEDFVTIYENVTIGDNCIIRSGARLGVQDYNYFMDETGLVHLPHYGDLIIKEDVEIGFNSVVGRALYPGDHTIIGRGSKLANQCGIGHDCILGERVMIYANAMLAGYCILGDNTHVTMSDCVKNGIKIGKNVQIDMGAVVIRDVPDNHKVFGNPARRVVSPE